MGVTKVENNALNQPKQPNVGVFVLIVMVLTVALTSATFALISLPADSKVLTSILSIAIACLVFSVAIFAVRFNGEIKAYASSSAKSAKSVPTPAKPMAVEQTKAGGQQRPEPRKQPAAA